MPPKGDAAELRADLDDGFARVANMLLEALSCAPLAGSELRVVMFIIRRTYGWAGQNRQAHKADTMTAASIAQATGMPKHTVHTAIKNLVNGQVLLSQKTTPGGPYRYGVNPDVNSWGEATPDWVMYRVTLKDARERGSYNPLGPSGEITTPLTNSHEAPNEKSRGAGGLSPRAAGAEPPPTDICTDIYTDKGNDSLPKPLVPAPPTKRKKTSSHDLQAAIDAHRATFSDGLCAVLDGYLDLCAEDNKSGAISKGRERTETEAFAKAVEKDGLTEDAWRYGLEAAVRKGAANLNYIRRAAQSYDPNAAAGNSNTRLFLLLNDNSRIYLDQCPNPWDEHHEIVGIVAKLQAEDNWVAAKGVTKRPYPGLTCIDGLFYYSGPEFPHKTTRVF